MNEVTGKNWEEDYKRKLCTAEEAVRHIKSGDRVVLGHACGEPVALVDAMVANAKAYIGVEIVHLVPKGQSSYCDPELKNSFHHNALFVGNSTREAVAEGRADFTPCFFHEVPNLFKTTLHPNVAMFTVSPPDNHGYCSFGISVDYTKAAAECADLRIAQVNKNMPRTLGDCFIQVSQLNYIVESDDPLIELQPPTISEVEKNIGKNVADLVHDGDTLQIGIGSIPDAALLFLKDKKDLGIHTEMFSNAVVDLVEAGVITNKRKNFMRGKLVVTFIMGTKRLYDFVNDNLSLNMAPVEWVNTPRIISKNDNMVSINSCVQVDLMGQVAAESVGLTQISGTGGQVDFVRGANMSKNGRTIMAMPSTAKGGTVSKIVPTLDEGTTVTTSRCDVNYVVTEYGVAQLKGRTLRDRARALIAIAHPAFRVSLIEEYERRFKAAF